jgi:preprotein translocase SecE subunit
MSIVDDSNEEVPEDVSEELAEAKQEAAAPKQNIFSRFANFLRGCWRELQRVQWPDRNQVVQATAVVIGFVAITGAYLGLADFLSSKFVELIL